jgi:hypothetical protein
MNISIPPPVSQIASLVTTLVGYGLLVLIGAAVMGRFGVRVPYVPTGDVNGLTWLCGAWWLWRGGKL